MLHQIVKSVLHGLYHIAIQENILVMELLCAVWRWFVTSYNQHGVKCIVVEVHVLVRQIPINLYKYQSKIKEKVILHLSVFSVPINLYKFQSKIKETVILHLSVFSVAYRFVELII